MKPLKLIAPLVCAVVAAVAAPFSTAAPAGLACPGQTYVHPFLPWGDSASYVLLPSGSLETTTGWSLTGGASLVAGNETFKVNSSADSHSLSLPSGGKATTPALCVTLLHPTLRFFMENSGSSSSSLEVQATTTVLGLKVTLPVAFVAAGKTWQPSPIVLFLENLVAPVGGQVQFTFTALGTGGKWQIDDVYVDPYKAR